MLKLLLLCDLGFAKRSFVQSYIDYWQLIAGEGVKECENLKMWECENVGMWEFENLKIRKFENDWGSWLNKPQ